MGNEQSVLNIEIQAANLVALATELGLNLTIEHEPLQPLAMGNYRPVIKVWPAKGGDGTTTVRVMPPRTAGLSDPTDQATLDMDREAYALINSQPILASLLYDINLLPEQIGRDVSRWRSMHSVVSHFRLLFAAFEPSAQIDDAHRKRYAAWCDSQDIHSNRFPAWDELSAVDRARWRAANPTGGSDGG